MLDYRPRRGAVRVVPAEREAEARPLLDGGPVRPLEGEGVRAGLDGEVAVHAHGHRGVLHHRQLGQPGEVVLVGGRTGRVGHNDSRS